MGEGGGAMRPAVGTIETVGRDNEIAVISDFLRESKGTAAVILLEACGLGRLMPPRPRMRENRLSWGAA
jgi:hypothetical protein